jgi:tetratricopeptide (TPR) repeat protein
VSTKPHLIASLAIAFALLSARAQDKPLFHFTEELGPHSVGLKVVEQFDYARVYHSTTDDLGKPHQGERARPLQTLIWYRAKKSSVGFSWGGISNLFAAARDNRIDALVALDGSMRYFPGLVKQAGDVHPDEMTIPLLFFTQGAMTMEDQARYLTDKNTNQGPSVLNTWMHGDLITVRMLGLIHTEFSSMYQRNEETWKEFPEQHDADYSREDGITGYALVARYTLHFLDAYLKHDAAAMAYLKKTPAENGAPPHLISVDFRAAKGIPASLESFRAELGRRGFDHISEIYAAMQKDNPDFKLDKSMLTAWGDDLIGENALPEAIDLLKFEVQTYPDTSSGHATLAEAYLKSGQKQLAIDNYKKALAINPNDDGAKEKLKELEAAAPAPK